MSGTRSIRTALVSVYNKEGLNEILHSLHKKGVKLLSTGGTQEFIDSLNIPCQKVEDITGYPSILGGRVKTLHPKIFGGILNRRDLSEDFSEVQKFSLPQIDLVIVDLYPFEETIASKANDDEIIEKIDIGGISLIRAAAKNYKDVLIIPSKQDYTFIRDILDTKGAKTDLKERLSMAKRAFEVTSHYDTTIKNWFSKK